MVTLGCGIVTASYAKVKWALRALPPIIAIQLMILNPPKDTEWENISCIYYFAEGRLSVFQVIINA